MRECVSPPKPHEAKTAMRSENASTMIIVSIAKLLTFRDNLEDSIVACVRRCGIGCRRRKIGCRMDGWEGGWII